MHDRQEVSCGVTQDRKYSDFRAEDRRLDREMQHRERRAERRDRHTEDRMLTREFSNVSFS